MISKANILGRKPLSALMLVGMAVGTDVCAAVPHEVLRIEREVILSEGHSPSPHVLVRTPNGGYVIAGGDNFENTEPWAIAVDGKGHTQWEYLDGTPESWTDHASSINQFHGAVTLSDGSTILCGEKIIDRRSFGLLTRIGANGKLIEQQYLSPHGDHSYSAGLRRCRPWGDGIVVLGTARHSEVPGYGWLIKLDAAGKLMWESTDPEGSSGDDVLELPGGDLLLAQQLPDPSLVRLDRNGKVVARRDLHAAPAFIEPLFGSSALSIAQLDAGTASTTFWKYDYDFDELRHPKGSESIGITRGYELPDHSLILFGGMEVHERIHGLDMHGGTANVGRVYPDSSMQNFPLQPLYTSTFVADAVPTGKPHEFVLIRYAMVPERGSPTYKDISGTLRKTGPFRAVLSWITLK